jgi:peptidoglycan/LPS O-acetylase OafA/YrhL
MEINGLPLHPLVVHAAVVFGPLAALAALAYAVVPRWRDRLRWPLLVLVLVATASIWAAFLTGESFRDSRPFFSQGALGAKIRHHEQLARTLRLVTTLFAVVTVVAVSLHERRGPARLALTVLLCATALATLVWSALTGDAGAQAVWSS